MYKLSKALFALFMINYIWFSRTEGGPAWMKIFLALGFTITGLLSAEGFTKRRSITFKLDKYLTHLAVFTLYVLMTGVFVARDVSIVISQTMFLVQILLILMYVNQVGEREGSLRFFYQVFMLVSALYTFSMLRNGVTHARSGRLYLSESSNPNSDGIIIAFGVYSSLKLIDFKKMGNLVPLFAFSIVEFYAIFLTGSRKALILAAAFFVFSFLKVWNIRRELSSVAKTFLTVVAIVSVAFGVLWLLPVYLSSSAYLRMQRADVGMQDRWKIAYDALIVFSKHPLFGVGINNYKLYSSVGMYAHSTIPELLAGTGLLGTTLFFVPYFSVLNSLLKKRMSRIDRIENWRLLICILAVSIVMIIPYGMPLSFFSVIMFVETYFAVNRLKD